MVTEIVKDISQKFTEELLNKRILDATVQDLVPVYYECALKAAEVTKNNERPEVFYTYDEALALSGYCRSHFSVMLGKCKVSRLSHATDDQIFPESELLKIPSIARNIKEGLAQKVESKQSNKVA